MCPDGPKARLRISAAFPAKPLRPPVTCFRRKQIYSTITAIELHVPAAFAAAPAAKHVQEFHLIPLFRNKDACPVPDGNRVAHLPQKPVIDSFFIFVFTFPCETTKKTAVSQAVRIHHIHLVFIHGCFHVFDKYQPKSAAERASCRCNRNLLFACLPFRIDVCFCPREIFTSKR